MYINNFPECVCLCRKITNAVVCAREYIRVHMSFVYILCIQGVSETMSEILRVQKNEN